MSAAAILAIGLCAVDPSVLRANFSEAGTHAARIDAGLILLDDLLDRQWSKDLTVELAMIGLPDAERAEQARMLIDEVLVLTDAVDVAIRGAAGDGTRVKTAATARRRSLPPSRVTDRSRP